MPDLGNNTDEPFFVEGLQTEKGGPLVLDEVVGSAVFVREADPGDDPSVRVRVDPGQRVIVTSPVGGVAIHLTDEEGEDDAIYWLRVVLDRREPGLVLARTLRFGEADDGRRVHVRPGERFELPKGAVQISLDGIEAFYQDLDPDRPHGSMAAVVRVWQKTAGIDPPELGLIVQAAAHRLDAAAYLMPRLLTVGESLRSDGEGGPRLVAAIDEYVHLVQGVVVALARCVALIERSRDLPGFELPRWDAIDRHGPALKDIRDAYEHIDERAFGRAWKAEDDRNLMIFDHTLLVREGIIVYFDHRLDVADLTDVIAACRSAVKGLIGGPPAPNA